MKTPESPRDSDYIDRHLDSQHMAKFEEEFVGETLFRAAEHLADTQEIDLGDLFELDRPLNVSITRPTTSGYSEYEFIVFAEDATEIPGEPGLQYVLRRSETELTPLSDISDEDRQRLQTLLEAEEEPDEELLALFDLSLEEQKSILCSKEYLTYYQAHQESLAVVKNVETHLSLDGTKIVSAGFSLSNDEPIDAGNTTDLKLMDSMMDLSIIELDDVRTMHEILYYLSLPGGVIATEVTSDYFDDDRVVRY